MSKRDKHIFGRSVGEFISAAAEREIRPDQGDTFAAEVPVGRDGLYADFVIQSGDKVILVESLYSVGSTGFASSVPVNTIAGLAHMAPQVYPGKHTRIVVVYDGEIPLSIKEELTSLNAEILSSDDPRLGKKLLGRKTD